MEIQEASHLELKKNFDLGLEMTQKKKSKIKTKETLSIHGVKEKGTSPI